MQLSPRLVGRSLRVVATAFPPVRRYVGQTGRVVACLPPESAPAVRLAFADGSEYLFDPDEVEDAPYDL
ncbi:MAG: hypothetical protein IT210_25600 [Armatimonadetes bacterium]|nr:hypothetical protein [Armatimonadota bacterium]